MRLRAEECTTMGFAASPFTLDRPAGHGAGYADAEKAASSGNDQLSNRPRPMRRRCVAPGPKQSGADLASATNCPAHLLLSCVAAFRNIGVQPLLDAVVHYLPSPLDSGDVEGVSVKDESEVRGADGMALRGSRIANFGLTPPCKRRS